MSRFAQFRAPLDSAVVSAPLSLPLPLALRDPRHIEVSRGGVSVRITLVRHSQARAVGLRVRRRNGEVVMTLPPGAEVTRARGFAESQFDWIAACLARRPQRVPFEVGSMIPLRGEPCLVRAGRRGAPARLTRRAGRATLWADPADVAGSVIAYLKKAARADLGRSVARYSRILGVRARSIQLKDTTSRWGSCSPEGDLSFSWRLSLAPGFVLDYLAAHEVGHLRDMSHSPAYWALVEGACPRTVEAETWLRENDVLLYSFG